ncbi:MAG: phosphopyruvate hydratase [Proteobacteria bacterium]|nr:phosphopyruvate hydratase [Pseudomonadota bacterium]
MSCSTDTRVASLQGRSVFDSRGRPTVEVEVILRCGAVGRAAAPSGASTGRHEAHELRDGDPSVHEGRGVQKAVDHVNGEIARNLINKNALDQSALDTFLRDLDGTKHFNRLGSNAVLPTSLAICRAAAAARAMPLYRYVALLAGNASPSLPLPMVNILSGGAHAARSMDLQDFLVIPVGAKDFTQAMRMVLGVRHAADQVMRERGLPTLLADEGGLSPGCKSTGKALDLLVAAIRTAGFEPGLEIAVALDVAASELYAADGYELRNEGRRLSSAEMISAVLDWRRRYPIISIEDALHEDDWDNWTKLTSALPATQIVGDDLFATNVSRIAQGVRLRAANAVLIKLNQNGTLSGTLEAMAEARRGGFATVVSARSGETEDTFIADLAVGTGAGQIKIGSVRTSERMAKYNQLVRIGEDASLPFELPSCLTTREPARGQ